MPMKKLKGGPAAGQELSIFESQDTDGEIVLVGGFNDCCADRYVVVGGDLVWEPDYLAAQ